MLEDFEGVLGRAGRLDGKPPANKKAKVEGGRTASASKQHTAKLHRLVDMFKVSFNQTLPLPLPYRSALYQI